MGKRTPWIEYEWRPDASGAMRVFWALKAGNGEVQCSSMQGSRDMTDARRSVIDAARNLCGDLLAVDASKPLSLRERVAAKRPPSLRKYQAKQAAKATIAANAVEDAKLFGVGLTVEQTQQRDGNGR